jgi:hypothetical protein
MQRDHRRSLDHPDAVGDKLGANHVEEQSSAVDFYSHRDVVAHSDHCVIEFRSRAAIRSSSARPGRFRLSGPKSKPKPSCSNRGKTWRCT